MAKIRSRLYILECVPKCEHAKEGEILFNFLDLTNPKALAFREVTTKSEFLGYLKRKRNLLGFDFIHLSGHGDPDENAFELPLGRVAAEEFPDSCFDGKVVTLSACALSRKKFMDPFMAVTKAKGVIAPMFDVAYDDAAIWYCNFYYLTLRHGFSPVGAVDRINRILCDDVPSKGRVKGAFYYWYPD